MTGCLGVIEAIKNNRRTNPMAVEQKRTVLSANGRVERGSNINGRFMLAGVRKCRKVRW